MLDFAGGTIRRVVDDIGSQAFHLAAFRLDSVTVPVPSNVKCGTELCKVRLGCHWKLMYCGY